MTSKALAADHPFKIWSRLKGDVSAGNWRKPAEKEFQAVMVVTDIRNYPYEPTRIFQDCSYTADETFRVLEMVDDPAGDDKVHRRHIRGQTLVQVPKTDAQAVKIIEIEGLF